MEKMEHILKGAELDNSWFRATVRDFLDDCGVLPDKPEKGKEEFPIYDADGNKHTAKYESQGRVFCTGWYNKFKPEEGDKIIVKIKDDERIIINPAEKEADQRISSFEEKKENKLQPSDKNSKSSLINIKIEINIYE